MSGLRYDRPLAIVSRAPGQVLVSGLGAMGVGQMWVEEEERHKDYPGYDEAPVQAEAPKDWWR